jgi:hypothetical protein
MHMMQSITKLALVKTKNFGLLIFMMLIMTLPLIYPALFKSLNYGVHQHVWVFRCIRWGTICSVVGAWPWLIAQIGKKNQWSAEYVQYWQSQRFRLLPWIAVFEIFISQNMLSYL